MVVMVLALWKVLFWNVGGKEHNLPDVGYKIYNIVVYLEPTDWPMTSTGNSNASVLSQ